MSCAKYYNCWGTGYSEDTKMEVGGGVKINMTAYHVKDKIAYTGGELVEN